MSRYLSYVLICCAIFWSCEEETYFPPGLYASQVERLLSGDGQKVWHLSELHVDGERQPTSSCSDSLELHFIRSVNVIDTWQLNACASEDSIYYGQMRATNDAGSTTNTNVFTDSLKFEEGVINFLLVKDITSVRFQFIRKQGGLDYLYSYTSDQ